MRRTIFQGVLLTFAIASHGVYANKLTREMIKQQFSVDGAVLHSVVDTDTNSVYISGLFRNVDSRNTGGGAVLYQDGNVLRDSPQFNGRVFSSVADGHGGFYVGGTFSKVGDFAVRYLVHFLSNGHIDRAFQPAVSGAVTKLAKVDDKLYAVSGNRVEQVDILSGTINNNFKLSTTGPIYALAATPRGVYIGGIFRSVNNHPLFALAKANPGDGELDLNFPHWTAGGVRAIQTVDGDAVIAAGYYTQTNGRTLTVVNKYNEATDKVDPVFSLPGYPIRVMAADHDWLYIAARDKTSGKGYRIERFSTVTGERDSGFVSPNISSSIEKILVTDNSIYVAGGFQQVNSATHKYIVRINKLSQKVDLNFNPHLNQRIYAVSVAADKVFVGGYFTMAGGIQQQYLAKLDLATGAADPAFHPVINYPPAAMAIYGDDLYVGGQFTRINGKKAYMMARISKYTGDRLGNEFAMSPNKPVYAMKVHDGYLYVGGAFTNISRNGATKYLARYNLRNNTYDRYFRLGLDQAVWSMAFGHDALYVGGQFSDHLRKYNTLTGERDNAFQPMVENRVTSLVYDNGTVYASTLAPFGVNGLFAYDAGTGIKDDFNAYAGRSTVLLKAGGFLYLANNVIRRMHLDTKKQDDSFNVIANGNVQALNYSLGHLYVGGYFSLINGVNQPYFSMIKV